VANPAPGDDLPEWEPLTPELVEDEAIRGDFVMRWAVVGLAILLGCSQIAETKTLVHIRSGEYMATHGLLPPAKDVFAYTRADQPWINLSWLFDLLAAAVHFLGGGVGLSIVQAMVAAAVFGLLVHTVRPGIRTWWGSTCAAFALLACFRQFTIQPELVTLLGVAATLWILVTSQEGTERRSPWMLVPLVWMWSQLDPRAFFGWGLVLLYGVGEAIGTAVGRPGFRDGAERKRYWLVAGASVLAAGLHPFLHHAWLTPVRLYGLEYPAWRAAYAAVSRSELAFFPLLDRRYWLALNFEGVAALYLACAAAVAMLLNARRVPLAHLATFVGVNAAAVMASHELAAASLVNCVLATLNAQDWFFAKYGQTYSTQWSFLLFSRGGRALTVLGMFGLAYLIISGRIDGPNGKRTGLGFDAELLQQMASYQDAVVDSYDDRPFPFVIRQGDLLIWVGQRTFIDSRLELYFPGGDENLISLHNKTRAALRRRHQSLPGSGDRPHWRKVFDQYEVTHVMPRMSGLSLAPNYRTFDDLLRSPDWKLTRQTPAVAVFYRTDRRQDLRLREYVDCHQWDPAQLAFRQDVAPVKDAHVWPTTTTAYQRALSVPRVVVPGEISQAAHDIHYAMRDNLTLPQRLGALYLAIRSCRAGLRSEPNVAEGYRQLGSAYAVLDQLEDLELRRHGIEVPRLLRYYQIAAAYQSAALLEPDDPVTHEKLAGLYLRVNRVDLALRHLQELFRLVPDPPSESGESDSAKAWEQLRKTADQLEQRTADLQAEIDKQMAQGTNRMNVALWAYQNGAALAAIKLFDDDKVSLLQSPQAQVMYGGWLIEAGRAEEADQLLRSLEQQAGPVLALLSGWRDYASYAAWAQGNYDRAAQHFESAIAESEQRRVQSALSSGPLTAASPPLLAPDRYPWLHVVAMEDIEVRRPFELGTLLLNLALCRLEQGDLPAAQSALRDGLDRIPYSPYRPLLLSYWECLTGERLELEPPPDWIPITGDLFAADKE
jgi:tetratricopeptide (TPR) repeat protein